MCTAVSFTAKTHYFGRNLDIDRSYGEEVCILPRRFPLAFRHQGEMLRHFAMIGMATVSHGVPLLYDGMNEHGLAMAGLNFPQNARYSPTAEGKDNIASFELLPWILGQCKTVDEAETLLSRLRITDDAFAPQMPPTPLHWMISDGERDIVVEPMHDGLHIHPDPVGVLTNNPPFPYQMENLQGYRHLRSDNREVKQEQKPYSAYSRGLGAVGLPGDLSSASRFVRAAFGRKHLTCGEDEASAVTAFFHLLSTVAMVKGLCKTDAGTWDITAYTACMNTEKGLYYYTTYENRRITCVDMHRTDLNAEKLTRFPLITGESILEQN